MAELLEAARRLAAGRADRDDLDRVHAAVAFFERAVTRHFVDEEGSVFPRLSTRRPELAAVLAELSAEHPTQIAMQAELAAAARELDGESRPSAGKTLLNAAARLADAHRAHVGREDGIFAEAHVALTAEDDAEIVAEMETRRGRADDTGGGHGGGGGGGRRHARAATEPEPHAAAKTASAARPRPVARSRATTEPGTIGATRPRGSTSRAAKPRSAGKPRAAAKPATAKLTAKHASVAARKGAQRTAKPAKPAAKRGASSKPARRGGASKRRA